MLVKDDTAYLLGEIQIMRIGILGHSRVDAQVRKPRQLTENGLR